MYFSMGNVTGSTLTTNSANKYSICMSVEHGLWPRAVPLKVAPKTGHDRLHIDSADTYGQSSTPHCLSCVEPWAMHLTTKGWDILSISSEVYPDHTASHEQVPSGKLGSVDSTFNHLVIPEESVLLSGNRVCCLCFFDPI